MTTNKTWRGLYLVTPNWDDTERLLQVTEAALKGGVSLLQYRHKTASPALRLEQASQLQNLCRAYAVPFVINDFLNLCIDLDADGVHVGGTDIAVAQARASLGADKIVGASCYGDLALAHRSVAEGASYVAFGGFYPSLVKQYPVTTQPAIVGIAKRELAVPVVVIGGMNLELARPLVAQGADMVAAISCIYNTEDPGQAARDFQGIFEENASTEY